MLHNSWLVAEAQLHFEMFDLALLWQDVTEKALAGQLLPFVC